MILIADAGSSKTDWALIGDNETQQVQTDGINPYFTSEKKLTAFLEKNELLASNKDSVDILFFYGAGCSNQSNIKKVNTVLKNFFPESDIFIYTDIFGAARALFQRESGIACILGTGANCCRFDGKKIIQCSPSLGYILGDEGSGAYFGKELLRTFLYGQLPAELSEEFNSRYQLKKDNILEQVYHDKFPNTYLAGFTSFLNEMQEHPYICKMIEKGIKKYFENHLLYLTENQNEKVRFAGSVAWYFKEVIQDVGKKYNVKADMFIQSPMEKLIRFHQKES